MTVTSRGHPLSSADNWNSKFLTKLDKVSLKYEIYEYFRKSNFFTTLWRLRHVVCSCNASLKVSVMLWTVKEFCKCERSWSNGQKLIEFLWWIKLRFCSMLSFWFTCLKTILHNWRSTRHQLSPGITVSTR